MPGERSKITEPYWLPGGPRPHEDEEPFIEVFRKFINQKRNKQMNNYWDLHRWSCDKPEEFWSDCWDYLGIIGEKGEGPYFDKSIPINQPQKWFPNAKLNVAENILLSHKSARSKSKTAVISTVEPDKSVNPTEPVELGRLTWDELYNEVGRAAHALKKLGVKPGESVVTFGASSCEMVIVYLATITIGAIFSSTPAEFGVAAVVDRYSTIRPKVLFTIDSYRYGGKEHSVTARAHEIVNTLDSLTQVIVIGHLQKDRQPKPEGVKGFPASGPTIRKWGEFMKLGNDAPAEIPFRRAEFSYPIWIVFSSGTTGKPKSILGPGGGLILSRKMTNVFHMNLDHRDTVLQFSTMGWIVYNLSINSLGIGGTALCYDGSPFHPQEVLWRLAEKYKVCQLGISPRYIQTIARNGFEPRKNHDLSALKQIYTTGAPVTPDVYDYVAQKIRGVFLSNNSGGTEIGGGLLHSTHTLPVYRGELQVPVLGIDLHAYSPDGTSLKDEEGTMIMKTAFPNMPVGFVADPQGKRYQETYFSDFPKPVFNMNDNIYINSLTGGTFVLGRADGVLNPSGVRFGSAELYYILEKYFQKEILDSIAVGQKISGNDERVVMFIKTSDGRAPSPQLVTRLRDAVAKNLSRRHVPEIFSFCPDVPVTMSGKKLESSVKKIINGTPLSKISKAGVQNPEAFDFFERWYKSNVERQARL